jgi:hypothetical protein
LMSDLNEEQVSFIQINFLISYCHFHEWFTCVQRFMCELSFLLFKTCY